MMTLTDNGKLLFMLQKTNWLATNATTIGLFTNNYTPARNSVLSNFVEPTTGQFPGYARQPGLGIWVVPSINGMGFAQSVAQVLTSFAPSSIGTGCTIYGYFYLWNATGQVIWAELNPAGPTPNIGLTLLPYVIQMQLSESQFNPALP